MYALNYSRNALKSTASKPLIARSVNGGVDGGRRPSMVSVNRTSNPITSQWIEPRTNQSAILIQKRCFSSSGSETHKNPESSALIYLQSRKFGESDIKSIRETTDGVSFKVIPLAGNDAADLDAVKRLVNTFFVRTIQSHPDSSALGGEKVLLFNPSNPKKGKPDSSFLMAFDGEQDPHLHGGPRHLDMWSSEPWSVIVGGSNPEVLKNSTIAFTKIEFPAGHVSLSFRKNMLHGFSGKGIGAISTHWTDSEELEEVKKKQGAQGKIDSKELMGTLTQFVPKEKVRIIGDQAIPWDVISQLQKAAPSDL